jgi:hypothetical protein
MGVGGGGRNANAGLTNAEKLFFSTQELTNSMKKRVTWLAHNKFHNYIKC